MNKTPKTFSQLRKEALADPARRANIEREKAAIEAGIDLYQLRKGLGLSQTEVGRRLGMTQARVSAIERADDLNLSTLQRYVGALGGRLEAQVAFGDSVIALTPARASRPRRATRRSPSGVTRRSRKGKRRAPGKASKTV
ncbi:MAG: helix-turn-helix domain-containing protein [Solirubrobacterales bacterium]